MPTLRDELHDIISRAIEGAVSDALRAQDRQAPKARRGRPPKSATASTAKTGRTRRRRRDRAQVAKMVGKVLGFIKQHGGKTTEQITKEMGGDRAAIRDALSRLRASKQVTTQGQRRAMTYSA